MGNVFFYLSNNSLLEKVPQCEKTILQANTGDCRGKTTLWYKATDLEPRYNLWALAQIFNFIKLTRVIIWAFVQLFLFWALVMDSILTLDSRRHWAQSLKLFFMPLTTQHNQRATRSTLPSFWIHWSVFFLSTCSEWFTRTSHFAAQNTPSSHNGAKRV